LLKVSRNIPIVFTTVADPVGAGYVQSLARPGGNATGFTNFEYAIGGKWLELLKQIAAAIAAGAGQFGAVQSVAGSLGVELRPVEVQDLPVQAPSKYELMINLKTAKLLGLTVPDKLMANADKMIE
jgi:ABC-type uncharacterized transport system substrate-binding protein